MTSVETFKDQALDDENDIMNHLDYRKLEMIYNDYALLGGPKLIKKLDLPFTPLLTTELLYISTNKILKGIMVHCE